MAWAAIDPATSPPSLAIGAAKAEHQLCLQIPGCNLSKSDGIWRVPLTWPAWVAFRAVWSVQPIEIMPALAEWEQAKWAEVQRRYEGRVALDAPEGLARQLLVMEDAAAAIRPPGTPELHLDAIQRGHVAWLMEWRRCVLGDPMGNGKTPPLIRALQLLHTQGEGLPALVICPDSAPRAWARKLAAWAPELRVQVVTGTALARRRALETGADVYVIVWQNLRYHTRLAAYPSQRFVICDEHGGTMGKSAAACEIHPKELNALGIRTVIADECHRAQNPTSKQARAMQWMAHHAENFWAVTGTLTASDVGNLWPVLNAIDPKGWPARGRYMDLYATPEYAWNGGKSYLGLRPDTEPYFHTCVDPLFRRIPGRSGRPERAEPEFRYPEMTPAQQRAYRQLAKQLLTDLPSGHQMVPDNSAVSFGRLVQLASSMVEVVEGETPDGFTDELVRLCLPSNKADDLLDFLTDNEGQWIVTCFSPDLVELCARKLDTAKIAHTRIVGGMSTDDKDRASLLFQGNPELRVIFLTAAGGESIDLQAARGIVFLQPDPSFIMREQKIGRGDRRGQLYPFRQVYMISPGTVDQRLFDLGTEKDERHREVTRDAEMMRWIVAASEGELATDAG
jgi:superfamily II DNA or RNA helicase